MFTSDTTVYVLADEIEEVSVSDLCLALSDRSYAVTLGLGIVYDDFHESVSNVKILGLSSNNLVELQLLESVTETGTGEIYHITLENGMELNCSAETEISLGYSSYKAASDLIVGEEIYVRYASDPAVVIQTQYKTYNVAWNQRASAITGIEILDAETLYSVIMKTDGHALVCDNLIVKDSSV